MSNPDATQPDDNPSTSTELNPHKELLAEAAAALRAETEQRESRRPKNVGQGTMGLVGDSLGGVALGAAAIVMGPVHGYKTAGPKGILGGALGGLAMGVAATTVGVGSGIAKFAQGTERTLDSFNARELPKRLIVKEGEDDGELYFRERQQLYDDLIKEGAASAGVSVLQPPVENELYKVLDVSVDATPNQIRKAYYRMAQKYHPDKHPDDVSATQMFQQISEAYQVLSDPVKREEYHRVGAAAASDGPMMDPKALFALMFSDFEHIVGDLATATILSTMPPEPTEASATNPDEPAATPAEPAAAQAEPSHISQARLEKKKEFQDAREAHLVSLLERRLEPWMNGNDKAFVEHAKREVRAMRAQPFGKDLLKTAAYVYKRQAAKVLETGPLRGVYGMLDSLGDKAHTLKSQFRALEGGVKALTASQTTTENESIDEAARREAVSTLGAVWLASVIDIELTLKHVVKTVLRHDKDHKPPKKVLKKAEGVLILSQIFAQA